MSPPPTDEGLEPLSAPVRGWFAHRFPAGPTPAQQAAWPAIAAGRHTLLIAPTGTGKTLAGFLAILDQLVRDHAAGPLPDTLRCVYISPLRSLGHDIERNLATPLEGIRLSLGLPESPIRVAVRNGDTSPYHRGKQRQKPPHLLITTPESLSLLLSQPAWITHFASVRHIIVDEIHALVPTKRGSDLAVSLERLAAAAQSDPCRIGLSATCRPPEPVARFLVGPTRPCTILQPPPPPSQKRPDLEVASLIQADEEPHRGLTYRRLLRRLDSEIDAGRTTVIFANTRAFTEKLTHDLRHARPDAPESIAAHHSALDASRRREVESALRDGTLRAVVTSTSLELGIDIGTADRTILVGLPGGVARCLQRVGRSGHQVGATSRGLLLAATPAELAGAIVTAAQAKAARVEPLRPIDLPLDVLCQQLVGMACAGECDVTRTLALFRRTAPFATLKPEDLNACLAYLRGDLAAPAGAFVPEPGAPPRFTSPRLWQSHGLFGIRSPRVARWFRANVGTINSEESVRVLADSQVIGTLEGSYAERLVPGDKFLLDGRALEMRKMRDGCLHAKPTAGEPTLPRWTSDRKALTDRLALALAQFRDRSGQFLATRGAGFLRTWITRAYALSPADAEVLVALFEAQQQASIIPNAQEALIEESPHPDGFAYTFHAPLARDACEALARATSARVGRIVGRNINLVVADLGWTLTLPDGARLSESDMPPLLDPANLADDVLEGLDRGGLLAHRFRYVASNALMVLRNHDGKRIRVGGQNWVSQRLYPLVKAACPDHPLLREARREVLEDLLDTPAAHAWLDSRPPLRFKRLESPSPFTLAWIDPGSAEVVFFEQPEAALKRLHARIVGARP